MASLSSSLNLAVQALVADQGALQITNSNIANANTPGYSRQIAVLDEATPTTAGGQSVDHGVVLEGYQSVRDQLVSSQIQQQTQSQGSFNAQTNSLQQIQPTFTTSTEDIGTQMSALFSSLSSLSTGPTSSASREAVISAGQNLAAAFNNASSTLTTQQAGLNNEATQDVSQINDLSQQIAALNPQIVQLSQAGQNTGSLQDKQNQLVLQLSNLTNVSITQTDNGETLTTGTGSPLVVGPQSYALQTAPGANAMVQIVDSNGNDITSAISGGDLGGAIQIRDKTVPALLNQLDTLANQFANAFNAAQKLGFDENGNRGQNFFNVPASVAGSAANISMAISSPSLIAASSDSTAESNGNLANLSAVQTTPLPSGQTPGNTYADLVFQVGSVASNATAESTATAQSLLQLNNQLSAVSGVSIDQESTNLITYQTAYEAAARVVSTIQGLFSTTLAMGTTAAQ